MIESVEIYWNPLVWLIAFIVIAIVAYIIRAFGKKEHKKGEQAKPFLSGVEEPSKEAVHVRGGNVYWGFVEALKGYYGAMKKMHSGRVNDYVAWFVVIASILFVVFFALVAIP